MPAVPAADLVVLTYEGRELLARTLPSVLAQRYEPATVTVLDDGSADGTAEWLASEWPQVRVVALGANRGVAAALNAAVAATDAPLVALLNNDVELVPDWLGLLAAELAADPRAAAACGKLLRFDERTRIDAAADGVLPSGVSLNRGHGERDEGQWDAPGAVLAACAGAALYRREAFAAVGEFDEDFHAYLEDVDWALRAALAGWTTRYQPRAVGFHMGGATTRRRAGFYANLQRRNELLVIAKDFPAPTLVRHAALIAAHQAVRFAGSVREGAGRDHLGAWLAALRALPRTLRARRAVQRSRTIPLAELERLMRLSLPPGIPRRERLAFALAPEAARNRRLARLEIRP